MNNGTTVVAAEGNEADDLAHPTMDITSPDDTTPVPRAITNACAVVPVEVPGVIGVTAEGDLELKSFYSSYGMGKADVIAATPATTDTATASASRTAGPLRGRPLLTVTCLPPPADSSTPAGRRTTSKARRWRRHMLRGWQQ
jgi:hypothetical protein